MRVGWVVALIIWLLPGSVARSQSGDEFSPLYQQALQLYRAGRHADATPIAERTLAAAERDHGAMHTNTGSALNLLGLLYTAQGRYADAEPVYKRALALREKTLGLEHPSVGTALNNLAELYRLQGRLAEAEPLYRRDLAILEKTAGPHHQDIATSLNNLALLLQARQRFAEAETAFSRALTIKEKALGPEHPEIASILNNLAELYRSQLRFVEAAPLHQRTLAIKQKSLHAQHPSIGVSLNNLALTHHDQGELAVAERFYTQALELAQSTLGENDPNLANTLINLGSLQLEQRRLSDAITQLERGAEMIAKRSQRDSQRIGRQQASGSEREAILSRSAFSLLTKAMRQQHEREPQRTELVGKAFLIAQRAQTSQAAASLALMSLRAATAKPDLAALVRERQDLVLEWHTRDRLLGVVFSQPPDRRNSQAEQELRKRLSAIDARIGQIEQTLATQFHDYAALTGQDPVGLHDVQASLAPNEALVLILVTPAWKRLAEETFIWGVTKTEARWVRTSLGSTALASLVAALRCGLDEAAWDGEGAGRCASAVGKRIEGEGLPFDLARAHDLYAALFGPIEDLIKDKQLLVVPSGPLAVLPLQALITEKPAGPSYGRAAWFTKRSAVTVLPSVGSLQSLRRLAKTSKATTPFLGFGNPLLHGPDGTDRRAWEKQSCQGSSNPTQITNRGHQASITKTVRSIDIEMLRGQYPLPETADELCAVAQSSGAAAASVHLGERFSEMAIKKLSADGSLASARVLHFATHGLLPSETEMLSASKLEPALILTPPDKPSDDDDGLLMASEIAQLKLDADWVILSACNTAAGDTNGGEALSGLARAFFYAGARTVLVSHWAVNSQATVELITRAFEQLKSDTNISRAEALRRSMVSLIELNDSYAHPANWAPFVLVDEGAR
jgi:CHAT domain-containing protein/tetratricopeptide (TPR) repeat protein